MVAQISPVKRVRRQRPSSPSFAHVDILARMGETICIIVPVEIRRTVFVEPAADAPPALLADRGGNVSPPVEAAHGACEFDEDPERWDGLS